MKEKAVIYARYSSDKQTEQSIDGQLRECYEYAKRNNFLVVEEYIDRALTGTSDKRPEFLKMIEDSKKKTFNYVIVDQLDRFARNRYDSAYYKSKLSKNSVRVLSARENTTNDASGILVEGLLESMAEYYSVELSQKTKRGMKETLLKGKWTGGFLPYGYDLKEQKLVINPQESEVVNKVFNDILQGLRLKDIANELNALGYKNKVGKPFISSYLSRMVKNRKYLGEISKTYKMDEAVIPAIVSLDLFNSVNARLAQNHKSTGKYKAEEPYYLSGQAICGKCGSPIVADSGVNKFGFVYRYYKCSNRKKNGKCKCNKEILTKEKLETTLINKTIKDIFKPDVVNEIAKNITISFNKEIGSNIEIENYEKQIKITIRKLNNLVDAIEQGIVTPTTKEKLLSLEKEKAELENKLAIAKNKCVEPMTVEKATKYLNNFAKQDYTKDKNRFKILETFIHSAYVFDEYVIVVYNGTNFDNKQFDSIDKEAINLINKQILSNDNCETFCEKQNNSKSLTDKENDNISQESSHNLNFGNKKTEHEQEFGFGLLGSPGKARTCDLPVNSRMLCHWATEEYCFGRFLASPS